MNSDWSSGNIQLLHLGNANTVASRQEDEYIKNLIIGDILKLYALANAQVSCVLLFLIIPT